MSHLKLLPPAHSESVHWDAVVHDPLVILERAESLITKSRDPDPARASFYARLACRLILRHGLKLMLPG